MQVKNLEERIKPDQLKEALTEIFSEYGNVIDLVAKTNLKAKGQAFVVFDETEAAERAIKEVQGFELFDKPMLLDYAKTRSDATMQREGTADDFESHKRRRLAEKGVYLFEILGLRSRADNVCKIFREETSTRSGRSAEEAQTARNRCCSRNRRHSTSQSISWCRSEVFQSCSRRGDTRGISTAK